MCAALACKSGDVSPSGRRPGARLPDVQPGAATPRRVIVTTSRYIDVASASSMPRSASAPSLEAANGGTVYSCDDAGSLVATDVFARREQWRARLPAALSVAPRRVLVGSALVYVLDEHAVGAFASATGSLRFVASVGRTLQREAVVTPVGAAALTRDDDADGAVLVGPTGTVMLLPAPAPPTPPDLDNTRQPAVVHSFDLASTPSGPVVEFLQGDNLMLAAFDRHGARTWTTPWDLGESGVRVAKTRLVSSGRRITWTTGVNRNYEQHGAVLRASDGTSEVVGELPAVTVLEGPSGELVGTLVASDNAVELRADDAVVWSTPYHSGRGVVSYVRVGADLIVAAYPYDPVDRESQLEIVRLAAATGAERWRRMLTLAAPLATGFMVAERQNLELVVAGSNVGVRLISEASTDAAVLSLATGDLLLSNTVE